MFSHCHLHLIVLLVCHVSIYTVNIIRAILDVARELVNCEYLLNYRIIVETFQCDSICRYVLPLHVSVSWPSSEVIRSTCLGTTITNFLIHTYKVLYIKDIYNYLD
jgi:hypothetical protein